MPQNQASKLLVVISINLTRLAFPDGVTYAYFDLEFAI